MLAYVLVAIVATVACVVDYDLTNADLHHPFWYLVGGDSAFTAAAHFKSTFDNGWYLENPYLGAPGILDQRDFPAPDLVYLGFMRVLAPFVSSWIAALDLYMILGFPFAALASLHVMRRFGVSLVPASAASLLFSFLPFHHDRLDGHTPLAFSQWAVPYGALLALAVLRDEEVFFRNADGGRLPRLVRSRATLAMAGYAVVVGITGHLYFTFFGVYGLVAAGLAAALRRRSALPLYRAGALVVVTLSAFAAQVAPMLVHRRTHGIVAEAWRSPADAEFFGMKIADLLLPQSKHRWLPFRRFKEIYDHAAPLVNENRMSYLGIVGAIGFLLLLLVLLARETKPILADLSVLNLSAILVGTIGGFGSVVAFAGFTEVRAYNRLSICIGFYSFFALAVFADRWIRRAKTRIARGIVVIVAGAITTFGIVETSFAGAEKHEAVKARWESDQAFVDRIEAALPEGAMVFQLPYLSFPEGGGIEKLADYAPMTPYLHSKRLRWSYGAMRGRRIDEWSRRTAALATLPMLERLALADFSAVYVSRAGYADRGEAICAELTEALGPPVAVSKDGLVVVYSLEERKHRLLASMTDAELRVRRDEVLTPVFLGFFDGFFPPDRRAPKLSVLSGRTGRMILQNPSSHVRHVTFRTFVRAAKGPARLHVSSELFDAELDVDERPVAFERSIELPPGDLDLRISSDGEASDEIVGARRFVIVFDEPRVDEP